MSQRAAYTFGDYRLDPERRVLLRSGKPLRLTPKDVGMLLALVERHGEVVDKKQLFARVWPGVVVEDCNLAQHVAILRRTLGDESELPRYIETVPRRGYRFIAPVSEVRPEPDAAGGEPVPRRSGRRPAWLSVGLLAALASALLLSSSMGARATGGSGDPIRALALLPIVNLTGDPRHDRLADAVREAVRHDLGRLSELRVTTKAAAVHYPERVRSSVRALAEELDVEGLVEGAVVREGKNLRVAMQLIDTRVDTHVWAETFDAEAGAAALGAAIGRCLRDHLRIELRDEDRLRLARSRPVHPEAYQAYELGRFFSGRRTVEGVLRGVDHFSQSIAQDPGYAPAHAGLADAYAQAAERLFLPLAPTLRLARAAAEMALRLDPDLAEAHQSLGAILQAEWDWEGAHRHFRRALELTPGSGPAHRRLGEFLVRRGRHSEAIALARAARDLDPVSVASNAALGAAFHYAGRHGEAVSQLQATLQLDAHDAAAQLLLGLALDAMGRHADAARALAAAVQLSGRDPAAVASLARAQARGGATREARAALPELQAWAASGRATSFQLALVLAALGERARALAMLELAYEERSPDLAYLASPPVLPELRDHPRVAAILGLMGLEPAGPGRASGGAAGAACGASPDAAGLERVSLGHDGRDPDGSALPDLPSMSRDGRFVAFASEAGNLVPRDANRVADVFVRDTCRTGAGSVPSCVPSTRRVSVSRGGGERQQPSRHPFISGDGHYVFFAARTGPESPGERGASGSWELYRIDRRTGEMRSVSALGGQGHATYLFPPTVAASGDGQFAAWTNPSDPGELLVADLRADTIEVAAHGAVGRPAISDDGRYVAFVSIHAYDLDDRNDAADVYLLDRAAATFTRITRAAGAGSVRGDLGIGMSADGKVIAYVTRDDLVDGDGIVDRNGALDVYLHDRRGERPRVRLVSAGPGGGAPGSASAQAARPFVSAEGNAVAFVSTAKDLIEPERGIRDPHPENPTPNVFLRDLAMGRTRQVTVGPCGEGANELFAGTAPGVSLSGDGTRVAFLSLADNLVEGDRNSSLDVFAAR